MMEDIKVIEAFNFLNAKGDKITVQRGVNMEDNTLRYRVYGNHVPFPIRCGTWFKGIPWGKFMSSFSELGYTLYAKANMHTGMVTSYPIPIDFEIQPDANSTQLHSILVGVEELYRKGNEENARILYEMARERSFYSLPYYDEYVENIPTPTSDSGKYDLNGEFVTRCTRFMKNGNSGRLTAIRLCHELSGEDICECKKFVDTIWEE